MKHAERILNLAMANANSTEWQALANDILADLHRAQGGSRFLEERLVEANAENAALRETLDALEQELDELQEDTKPR